MQKKIFLIFVLTSIISAIYCQKNKTIIVKRGRVQICNKNLKSGEFCILEKNDTIKTLPSSLVFITNNASLVELLPNKTYLLKDINKLFVSKNNSFNNDFIQLIKDQKYKVEDKSGSTTRSVESSWDYLPNDGFQSLENMVYLKINKKVNQITSDIKLFKLGDKDTINIKVSDLVNGVKLGTPGEYHWIYSTQKALYDNYFILPSINEQKKMIEAFEKFKNTISNFSIEMQEHLIQEYMIVNKLFN